MEVYLRGNAQIFISVLSLPIRYAMTNAVKEIVQHKKSVEEVHNSMQKGLEEKLDAEHEQENKKYS